METPALLALLAVLAVLALIVVAATLKNHKKEGLAAPGGPGAGAVAMGGPYADVSALDCAYSAGAPPYPIGDGHIRVWGPAPGTFGALMGRPPG